MKENLETDELKAKGKKILDEEQVEEIKQEAKRKIEETKKATIEKTEEIKEKLEDEAEKQKSFKILGFKVWRLMAYFVIYSFLGFILETTYGVLTKGVIESRQSFLYGPFCGIYGLGAVIMIVLLQYFKKNNYTIFFGGYIIGSGIEYFVSLIGEKILHVKWWDYSSEPFNIGGRVCLFYSIAWGILAIYLITHINLLIDRLIDKIKSKLHKYMLPVLFDIATAFLLVDCVISGIAMNVFYARLVYNYKIKIPNAEIYAKAYEDIEENETWKKFTDKHFSDEKMLKTYPNLKMQDVDGNIIFVKDILKDIKPYYVKLYTPKNNVKLTGVETVTYQEND